MMIDWGRLKCLRDEIGAEDFGEVVELFFDEAGGEIAALRSDQGGDTLGARLHSLKGSALNFGFSTFSALCQQGEGAVAAGQPEHVDVPTILTSFEQSKAEFIANLSQLDLP